VSAIITAAKEAVFYLAFICSFLCFLVAASRRTTTPDLLYLRTLWRYTNAVIIIIIIIIIITRDVSVDKEVLIKFLKSPASGSRSRNCLKDS